MSCHTKQYSESTLHKLSGKTLLNHSIRSSSVDANFDLIF